MKTATLSRRLLAGAAGLAIGLGGLLAVSTPAQAVGETPSTSSVEFLDNCHGTKVILEVGTVPGTYQYKISPADEDWQGVEGGTVVKEFFDKDAGEIRVKVRHKVDAVTHGPSWVVILDKTHTWKKPRLCKDIPEPEGTPPTCDADGSITIPEDQSPAHVDPFEYEVNGEPAERGSTVDVGPGTHTVKAYWQGQFYKKWVFDLPEPRDCPTPPPGETPPPDEDPGEGGELPKTGAQSALIAGGALIMLTLGGAMYLVARRRRITFTA